MCLFIHLHIHNKTGIVMSIVVLIVYKQGLPKYPTLWFYMNKNLAY